MTLRDRGPIECIMRKIDAKCISFCFDMNSVFTSMPEGLNDNWQLKMSAYARAEHELRAATNFHLHTYDLQP